MKNYIYEALSSLKRLNEESILTEDIESMKKYYPNIPDDQFMKYIELDPTYRGGNTAGTYAKWILGLANLGKLDNVGHVKDLLTRFEDNKKNLVNKDIMKYKSIEEVDDMLNDESSYKELSHRQEVRQRQNDRKNADLGKDAEKVYETSKWEVWVPKTYAASCKLGQGAYWCTASTESDYYYNYYKDKYGGDYYIFIDKSHNGLKYQLHIESYQFMDKDDDSASLEEFIYRNKDLVDFIDKIMKKNFRIDDSYTTDDIEEMVTAGESDRDSLSGDVCRAILDMDFGYQYYDYSYLRRYSVAELAKDFDIDKIKNILNRESVINDYDLSDDDFDLLDEDIDEFMEEHPDIQSVLMNSYIQAVETGTSDAAYSWLMSELEDKGYHDNGDGTFTLDTSDIYTLCSTWDNFETLYGLGVTINIRLPYYGIDTEFDEDAFYDYFYDNLYYNLQ